MKIFLSGGTSSIGGYVVKYLIEEGHTLHLLVRSKDRLDAIFKHEQIRLFEGDLSDCALLTEAMDGCDQVYHMAALAKVWLKDAKKFFDVNLTGTTNILEAARLSKVSKIVITSSAGVYGPSENGIVNEGKNREMDFFNEYESSKALAELKIKEYHIEHGLNVIIVSPTRVYGPILFGIPGSINILINKYINGSWRILPGTGKEIGNYAYIEDVAKGHLLAMEYGKSGHSYILGGENCTYIEFFDHLSELGSIQRKLFKVPLFFQNFFASIQLFMAEKFGTEPSITPKWVAKGKFHWEVSSEKALNELGYQITPLKEGLKRTVGSMKKNK
jgi:nucleoside-diphosphate-sugar epimerase